MEARNSICKKISNRRIAAKGFGEKLWDEKMVGWINWITQTRYHDPENRCMGNRERAAGSEFRCLLSGDTRILLPAAG